MRLANIRLANGRRTLAACLTEGVVVDVGKLPVDPAISIRQAYEHGEEYIRELALRCLSPARTHLLSRDDIACFLPICELDAKIFCVGLNYVSHAEELGLAIPKQPSIFSRYGSTCVGHEQSILIPRSSQAVDWEGELALVIGKPIKYVGETHALGALAGVTCFNDISMRDFQERLPRITLAKNFDASGPIGPWLVSIDEIPDIDALTIETRVNGTVMQKASTSEFIFPTPFLIDLISQACALKPGDVIATGTPAGVAWRRKPPNFLRDGDVVEVKIDGVGTLRNVARAEG
jgi:2-keto-4-pentenoate hydratase/2-oxohepta-3-ene-1,7-dioic acid hydratase in catechol pathway